MMEEKWISISESNDTYSISNLSRVKINKSQKIVKPRLTDKGYSVVTFNNNNKVRTCKLHRLVMIYFKPIENPNLYDVNHINWDREDNRIENLEWISRKENLKLRRMEFDSFKTLAKLHKKYNDNYLNEYLLKLK